MTPLISESSIQKVLDKTGKSRLKLADKLRVHVSEIAMICRRVKPCHPRLRAQIAIALRVPESQLFDDAGYATRRLRRGKQHWRRHDMLHEPGFTGNHEVAENDSVDLGRIA